MSEFWIHLHNDSVDSWFERGFKKNRVVKEQKRGKKANEKRSKAEKFDLSNLINDSISRVERSRAPEEERVVDQLLDANSSRNKGVITKILDAACATSVWHEYGKLAQGGIAATVERAKIIERKLKRKRNAKAKKRIAALKNGCNEYFEGELKNVLSMTNMREFMRNPDKVLIAEAIDLLRKFVPAARTDAMQSVLNFLDHENVEKNKLVDHIFDEARPPLPLGYAEWASTRSGTLDSAASDEQQHRVLRQIEESVQYSERKAEAQLSVHCKNLLQRHRLRIEHGIVDDDNDNFD
ncbi:hypothetical protein BC940DRAFT_334350 [Gongronella butleri]|nr:hypothetical protein BC940DRAFT_334350 [Gongronella butleri]